MINMRVIELMVGLFVLAAIASLIYLSLNVSGLTQSNDDTYTLRAYFSNISGLTSRAKVSVSGVSIGTVDSITLDHEEKRALVLMSINKSVDYLPTDTAASIFTSGLLGEKYIGLIFGADEEFLTDGDVIYDTQSSVVLEDLIGSFLLRADE